MTTNHEQYAFCTHCGVLRLILTNEELDGTVTSFCRACRKPLSSTAAPKADAQEPYAFCYSCGALRLIRLEQAVGHTGAVTAFCDACGSPFGMTAPKARSPKRLLATKQDEAEGTAREPMSLEEALVILGEAGASWANIGHLMYDIAKLKEHSAASKTQGRLSMREAIRMRGNKMITKLSRLLGNVLCYLGMHNGTIWHLDGLGNRHCGRCYKFLGNKA